MSINESSMPAVQVAQDGCKSEQAPLLCAWENTGVTVVIQQRVKRVRKSSHTTRRGHIKGCGIVLDITLQKR